MRIVETAVFDSLAGRLTGAGVTKSARFIQDLAGVFADEQARQADEPNKLVYEVEMHDQCGEVEGGLYFGISRLQPGKVGDEYYMTKGHYHSIRNRGEYYWGLGGSGYLVLMDENRKAWVERVSAGSLHYISGHVAHRLVNTGSDELVVGACWPADAGHDYATIQDEGFSVRLLERDGEVYFAEV